MLIVASLASIVYTINFYSQYSPQGAQQDEYIKGCEPSTILPGPYDWIKTQTLTGIAAMLLLVIHYYARTWGWPHDLIELVRVRASALKAVRGVYDSL